MLRFAEYLELEDFRQRTASSYYRALRLIGEHFGKDPEVLKEEDLRGFFVYLRRDRKWAPAEKPACSGFSSCSKRESNRRQSPNRSRNGRSFARVAEAPSAGSKKCPAPLRNSATNTSSTP